MKECQMDELSNSELKLAAEFESYLEFCHRIGVRDPSSIAKASALDGIKNPAAPASRWAGYQPRKDQ